MLVKHQVSGLIDEGIARPNHPVEDIEVATTRKGRPRIECLVKAAEFQ
jgi:hypothetical protein